MAEIDRDRERLISCIWVFWLNACPKHTCGAQGDQKNPLLCHELELHMVLDSCVGSGTVVPLEQQVLLIAPLQSQVVVLWFSDKQRHVFPAVFWFSLGANVVPAICMLPSLSWPCTSSSLWVKVLDRLRVFCS